MVSGTYDGPAARVARLLLAMTILFSTPAVPALAQTTAKPAPDDTPSVRVGASIFADYTVTSEPRVTDTDGNLVSPNAFTVARAYVNVTGTVTRRISFRVTPDVVRESGTGSSAAGSQLFRLKYAYGQYSLDDWLPRGSFVRFGMQQTPWIDFIDSVYRYRFQGPLFEDREGFLSSADVGATIRAALPGDYGDIHGGAYNGETYARAEANDQKAFMIRATVRPLPRRPVLRGLRVTAFYDHDAYVRDAERRRAIVALTYEHPYVNAGVNLLSTADRTRAASLRLEGHGFSAWATPKTPKGWGWEGLLRIDRVRQQQAASPLDSERERLIAGIAYWFPTQGSATAAVLLNHERVNNDNYVPNRAHERRWSVHTLVTF